MTLTHDGWEPIWCGKPIRSMTYDELRDTHAAISKELDASMPCQLADHFDMSMERIGLAMARTFCCTMALKKRDKAGS